MANPTNKDLINSQLIDQYQVNNWAGASVPCDGLTLHDLRIRFRNELSGYIENTLIPDDLPNDVERQWINDGIGQLWPHDWQGVTKSYLMVNNRTVYTLPDDCEHVISVLSATQDVNEKQLKVSKLPHYDGWMFETNYIDATTTITSDGEPWIDQIKKAVVIRDPAMLSPMAIRSTVPSREAIASGSYPWVLVRYVRRWKDMQEEYDCINPTPNRVQAIIFYACSQYFNSQFQVSTESIRYRNYMEISQRFLQMSMQQLIKDSKPLFIS